MKRLIFSFLFLTAAVAATAQRRSTVSGVVADADTRRAMAGVVVELIPAGDSTKAAFVVSGAGGAFSTGAARGVVNIRARMIGYQPVRDLRVDISEARHTLDTIFMSQGVQIDAVVKEAVAMRTSTKGDTLIYSADAFKVASDANVSGLLEKMPGIKVENGAVQAQGETVKKVLIDGKEFFGEDVNAAITALPAEAVKNVEVFDKLSDNAEFTGIDDGEGYKAINIVTRESMRQGIMGQVQALYGYEPGAKKHYGLVGGNVSVFEGDSKTTIGGTLNNLNERHFTSEDILGVGDDDGIAKVGRFQANYINELGRRKQLKVNASYMFDITDSYNHSDIDREYFDGGDYSRMMSENTRNRVRRNHTFNARIDWKPNKYNELRIRPFVRTAGTSASRNGYELYSADESQNLLNFWERGRESGWVGGMNVNYRVRLGKPGRTLSVFLNGTYDPDDELEESYDENLDGSATRLRKPSYDYNYSMMAGLTYTEPVSKNSLVNLDYMVRYNYENIDNKGYEWNDAANDYDADPSDLYTGIYDTDYTVQRVGPGYRMQKGKNTFSAGVFYQHSTLNSDRVEPEAAHVRQSFENVTYSAMLVTQFESGANIRLFLNSMTRNPSVSDLQDVLNINRKNYSKGDPGLKPQYVNMMFLRVIIPTIDKGRTFSLHLRGNYTLNSIARGTVSNSAGWVIPGTDIALDGVGRYSTPVNMDGAWSSSVGVDYGFPVTWIKSNLNLGANASLGGSPSQMGVWTGVGDEIEWTRNMSRTTSAGGSATIGSNISEKVDFRLSYNLSYNNVRNSGFAASNSEYMRHQLRGDAKFVLPLGFTLAGNGTFYHYKSLTGVPFLRRYVLVNGAVGKKVFRDRSGEVSLFVNDIFNQNAGFRRETQAQYIQSVTSSVIGRYVGLKFTWNIRKFGKNGSRNMDLYKTDDNQHMHGPAPSGSRPSGPPPGGFRPF